jgi:hypothetical protein
MTTELYIGPLIERDGKFAYDVFSTEDGLRSSFRYPRIEQARHDRRTMIAEMCSIDRHRIEVCETLAEFERLRARAEQHPDYGSRTREISCEQPAKHK